MILLMSLFFVKFASASEIADLSSNNLPGNVFAQLPDGTTMIMISDASIFQESTSPLRIREVLALYTGREKYKRFGGGYHKPIKDKQEEYKRYITRNPYINPDEDIIAQRILLSLKDAVEYCNVLYPRPR